MFDDLIKAAINRGIEKGYRLALSQVRQAALNWDIPTVREAFEQQANMMEEALERSSDGFESGEVN